MRTFYTTYPDIYHYQLLALWRDILIIQKGQSVILGELDIVLYLPGISHIQTSVWKQNAFLPSFRKKEKENHGAFPYLSNLITFLFFIFLFF